MKGLLCWLGWHAWAIVHDASPWLMHLHRLAGTLHECRRCHERRDWRGDPQLWAVKCRGCERALLPENACIADGCPCNTPRGVNHGLVPPAVCTCDVCDPEKTGASRCRPWWKVRP